MSFEFDTPKPASTNRYAHVRCATCQGDRFVSFGSRLVDETPWMRLKGIKAPKAAAIEELAPCPECNTTVDAGFFRPDGTPVTPPDPAKVKERLK